MQKLSTWQTSRLAFIESYIYMPLNCIIKVQGYAVLVFNNKFNPPHNNVLTSTEPNYCPKHQCIVLILMFS